MLFQSAGPSPPAVTPRAGGLPSTNFASNSSLIRLQRGGKIHKLVPKGNCVNDARARASRHAQRLEFRLKYQPVKEVAADVRRRKSVASPPENPLRYLSGYQPRAFFNRL